MAYLKEVIFAAIVCGLLVRLAPDSKTGSGKLVKYTASLALLCILVTPLIGGAGGIGDILTGLTDPAGDIGDKSASSYKSTLDVVSGEICGAAVSAAAENFSVPEEDLRLKLIIDKSDSGEFTIREAAVYPSGAAVNIGSQELGDYFSRILGCPAEVISDE